MKTTKRLQDINGNVCLLLDAGKNPLIVAIATGEPASEEGLIKVKAVDNLDNPHFKAGHCYEYGAGMPVGKIWQNVKAYHLEKEQNGGITTKMDVIIFSEDSPEGKNEPTMSNR
jgi:hypothetical protein